MVKLYAKKALYWSLLILNSLVLQAGSLFAKHSNTKASEVFNPLPWQQEVNLETTIANLGTMVLSSLSAVKEGNEPNELQTDGVVKISIPDGKGGHYVGGEFTTLQGVPRKNLAHILADNSVDETWNLNPNGKVDSLVLHNDNLFVLGNFTEIAGSPRNGLANLSTTTGQLTNWNPDLNHRVESMAISGNIVYVGGYFTTISGQSRNYLASLDATTGHLTNWNPNTNGPVYCLAISGNTVYV